ncbi:ribosome silencing factor [Futiania mangrovi]|uniref:Ribosomal silencing factor RsfS n=1 Tax=Futiania mangrovi TaxID=2959716 RepID=A0A9J6P9Q0_9PROT|nr:ribosome silencing factor [Futiania mangrovii]MCP1336708.1 ribosome silencing factor [Futiania mangrovii]
MATQTGTAPVNLAAPRDGDAASRDLLDLILTSLDDDKAEDVVSIDLRGKTTLADHMVVASGRSNRQVSSMADKLVRRLKEAGRGGSLRTEGLSQGDWALIDAGDVIVHIFRPEVRAFYDLERMWSVPGEPARD